MGIDINGVAHVILTVRDMNASRPFYKSFLAFMGLTEVIDSDVYIYFVGGRTAVGLRPADAAQANDRFNQERCGLHHVCFRARSREDVDALHKHVATLGAKIIHDPEEQGFVPGYYSVLFEDPDGIRIEVNHVPGKGVFEPGVKRIDV